MPNHKKPTALHVLNGNPSKIKDLGKGEPKPAPVEPYIPEWLDDIAVNEWKRLAPKLVKLGLLTEIDTIPFAMLVQEYSDVIQLRGYIKENGRTFNHVNTKGEANETTRPEVYMLQKATQMLKSLTVEFGLTASSRGRLEIAGMDIDNDPMEELLRNGQ
jgi:P27 family predicted phage terminase small subunit